MPDFARRSRWCRAGRRVRAALAAMLAATCAAPAIAQDGAAQPPAAAMPAGQQFIELNRAIRAYLDGDSETAERLFGTLLEQKDRGEFEITCKYYLGLISLERGLAVAREVGRMKEAEDAERAKGQDARAIGNDEAAARHDEEARRLEQDGRAQADIAQASFNKARGHFEAVTHLADPRADTVRAGLLLGIAQLASDYKGITADETAFDLAKRAEDTLAAYVATDAGRDDRYGYFYLGVARYRLADEYATDKSGRFGRPMQTEAALSLAGADTALSKSLQMSEADAAAGRISPSEVEIARITIQYYRALLAIQRRENQTARRELVEMVRVQTPPDQPVQLAEQEGDTPLVAQAKRIIRALDLSEEKAPSPTTLDVTRPIGPLEVDGRLYVGNGFDSNVILLGRDTTLPPGLKRSDDYFLSLGADVNVTRYITGREAPGIGESLALGIGGYTGHTWQPNIAEYDVNRYGGRAFMTWQPVVDLYLGLQYDYTWTMLGHDPFIASNRLTPSITKIWRNGSPSRNLKDTELGRTDAYFIWDERDYFDESGDFRLNRDGRYQAIGLQHTFNLVQARQLPWMKSYLASNETDARLFGADWLAFTVGYNYRNERTEGVEFDEAANVLIFGLSVPLPLRFTFDLIGEFGWEDYAGASIFDFERKERRDFVQRYDFTLTHTLVARGEQAAMRTLEMKIRGGISLTFQNSNIWDRLGQDLYEYNRQLYLIALEIRF